MFQYANTTLGPIIRINPHEIHVRDSTWLDTLYISPAAVRFFGFE